MAGCRQPAFGIAADLGPRRGLEPREGRHPPLGGAATTPERLRVYRVARANEPCICTEKPLGVYLNLVEGLLWVQDVVRSNRTTPTKGLDSSESRPDRLPGGAAYPMSGTGSTRRSSTAQVAQWQSQRGPGCGWSTPRA